MADKLLIVDAVGHDRSVAEGTLLSTAMSFELVGFIDSWPTNSQVQEHPILGNISNLDQYLVHAKSAIVAIGNNKLQFAVSLG